MIVLVPLTSTYILGRVCLNLNYNGMCGDHHLQTFRLSKKFWALMCTTQCTKSYLLQKKSWPFSFTLLKHHICHCVQSEKLFYYNLKVRFISCFHVIFAKNWVTVKSVIVHIETAPIVCMNFQKKNV